MVATNFENERRARELENTRRLNEIIRSSREQREKEWQEAYDDQTGFGFMVFIFFGLPMLVLFIIFMGNLS